MSSTKPHSAQTLFDGIMQFIAESRELLESGAVMELAGLDDQVRSLCDAVLQLSQEERVLYADRLQHVLADLQILGEAMVTQRDLVAEEIRSISHHKKAASAYRVAEASDGYKNEEDQ